MFAALALAAYVTVSPGNTLSGIASHHGITWEQLWYANYREVRDPNLIFPGEKLVIPARNAPSAPQSAVNKWVYSSNEGATGPAALPYHGTGTVVHQVTAAAPTAAAPVTGGIPGWATCIVARESGGNATVVNASSGAAGLFQDLPSTWGGYDGYATASEAPVSVQIAFNQILSDYGTNLSPWAADGCPGT